MLISQLVIPYSVMAIVRLPLHYTNRHKDACPNSMSRIALLHNSIHHLQWNIFLNPMPINLKIIFDDRLCNADLWGCPFHWDLAT